MAKSENDIQSEIRKSLCRGKSRMFRNNVGCINGVRFGLCTGSGDLIGFNVVEVTPEMVGSKVAIFTSCEVKAEGKKILAGSPQEKWLNMINRFGGIAIQATSVKEATTRICEAIIKKQKNIC